MLLAQTPAFVGDLTQILGLVLAGAASVGIAWRIIKPSVHASVGEIVERVTEPRFRQLDESLNDTRADLTDRITDSNARLDAHMKSEEALNRALLKLLEGRFK